MLDELAGSPPRALELPRRAANGAECEGFFRDWEVWSAEILETHLSYSILGYFRPGTRGPTAG